MWIQALPADTSLISGYKPYLQIQALLRIGACKVSLRYKPYQQIQALPVDTNLTSRYKPYLRIQALPVDKPYLVDGYKFDIRVYTLITSCDPLRIFVYNEGLVRLVWQIQALPADKPYLVDGYKFDIRVYTLITSCDPLRIFVYNEGLVSTFFVPAYLSLNATEALLADQASLRIFVYNEGLVRYKPYLVDGYKFDIHVYTLITSCDPLRIFVYNEGLVRFATSRYADPNVTNTTNVFMHLTNYALNKHSRTYVYDSEAGSKRKISTLNKILLSQGIDLDRLWHSVDQVIVKTIISAWPILKHSYHACFPSHDMVHACFEILGFDILLDHKLHPYILEVNHSPSFHTDTQLDREVKEALLTDTFTMLNIWQCDKRRVLEEDRKRVRDRLLQTNKFSDFTPLDDKIEPEKSPWQTQIQWEETHLGNFRRVYPVGEQYASLFQQPSGSLYTATAASRARGDCTRQQQQEFQPSGSLYTATAASRARGDCTRQQQQEFQQQKAKAEAMKKPTQAASKEKKAADEADTEKGDKKDEDGKKKEILKPKSIKGDLRKTKDERGSTLSTVAEKPAKPAPTYVSRSFEPDHIVEKEERERLPDHIVEKEERERVNLLVQRDFLIRSYGMLEQPDHIVEKEERERVNLLVQRDFLIRSYGMLEQPDHIVEKEERERVNLLAQRDFLIRSYGMLEQIYLVMKKMGTLRPEDERKYGVYGRLADVSNTPKTAVKKSQTLLTHRPQHYGDYLDDDELRVECRDAVIYRRPPPSRRAICRSLFSLRSKNLTSLLPGRGPLPRRASQYKQ
ncbi:tubulin-tyrosine ligase family domain-containing protein [Phthorimaea operculella]|nr:tubulin-tyrosine ligase family domain-containing protein [Phthorimaea operculella]